MGLILRVVGWVLALAGLAFVLLIAGVAVAILLVFFRGSGFDGCRAGEGSPPAMVETTRGLADAFQARWDQFESRLDRGLGGTAVFSNAEATSRASLYFQSQGGRISALTLCFEPGKARAAAEVRDVLGRDLEVLVEGSLDFSGPSPRLELSKLRAGGLPLLGPFRGALEDLVNDQLRDLRVKHTISASFDWDRVTISASP